jgi:outer membrane lipoprotein carrier protein
MQADFKQTIVIGKKPRISYGVMMVSRPNKFRWNYSSESQMIISDGNKIYIYDVPLQQVTIKPLGQAVDKSPAAVLAGANNMQKLYNISELPQSSKQLKWVQIKPKQNDENNGFKLVLMGFDQQQQLAEMRFTDSFDNQTMLQFSHLKLGLTFPASNFKFVIPANVDVAE